MGNYDTGRKTDFECFIQDAELLNSIPTRPCHVIYGHGDKSYSCLVGIGLRQLSNYCLQGTYFFA